MLVCKIGIVMTYVELEKAIVDRVPEIHSGYQAALELYDESEPTYGAIITLEDFVVPLLIRLAEDNTIEANQRLLELFGWFEYLATKAGNEARNAVGTGICPALITDKASYLPKFAPLMGKATKELCIIMFHQYRVSDRTKQLLGAP